jgi:hypothetical protein
VCAVVDGDEMLVRISNYIYYKKAHDGAFIPDFDVLCKLVVERFRILLIPNDCDAIDVDCHEELSSNVDVRI